MLKNPSTKFGRLTVLFIAVCGGITALLALVLLVFESAGPIHSAVWHMHHGNTVSFDGHRFHLPLSWYPQPDNGPGELTLQYTRFGVVGVGFITLATHPQALNEQAAIDRIAAMTANLNKSQSSPSDRWATETLRGRSLTFHCTMSTTQGVSETLICQAANSNLSILTTTAGRTAHTQALDIIETSE